MITVNIVLLLTISKLENSSHGDAIFLHKERKLPLQKLKEVYPSSYQGCLFSRVEHVLLGCNHLYRPAKNINIRLKIVLLGQMSQLSPCNKFTFTDHLDG